MRVVNMIEVSKFVEDLAIMHNGLLISISETL